MTKLESTIEVLEELHNKLKYTDVTCSIRSVIRYEQDAAFEQMLSILKKVRDVEGMANAAINAIEGSVVTMDGEQKEAAEKIIASTLSDWLVE